MLLFFFMGAWKSNGYTTRARNNFFTRQSFVWFKGDIIEEVQYKNGRARFVVALKTGLLAQRLVPVCGNIAVILSVDSAAIPHYGDEIQLPNKMTAIDEPRNPGEFDYRAFLAAKNIYHQVFLQARECRTTGLKHAHPLWAWAIRLREKGVQLYRKLLPDDEIFALASTLILGYRSDLQEETFSAYSKTGTIHALSVSGMHVGIVYLVLNFFLQFLAHGNIQKGIKVLLICLFVWFYALLTGLSPAALRAAWMLSILIIAKTFQQQTNSINILAFAAGCMLFANPFLLWDVGFQLSFLAVWGLIYLHPRIYMLLEIKNKWLDKLWAMIALSLAAQLATLTLSVYYFHQFPLYFLLGNLWLSLPITLLMYIGLLILLGLHFLAPAFQILMHWTNVGLKAIAALPFSTLEHIWLSPLQTLLLTAALSSIILAFHYRRKSFLFLSLVCWLVFEGGQCRLYFQHKRQREIIFFSLRRGYAAAFISGRKAVIVSDLNEKDKNFLFSVKPALAQRAVKQFLIVSRHGNFNGNFLKKKAYQINFYQFRLLLPEYIPDNEQFRVSDRFDLVWALHYRDDTLTRLMEAIPSALFLLESSPFTEKARFPEKMQERGYFLKKNKAYLIRLSP